MLKPWAVAPGGEDGVPITVTVRQMAPDPVLVMCAAASCVTPKRATFSPPGRVETP